MDRSDCVEFSTSISRVQIMVTDLQKKSVQAIVNVFETGGPLGDYGKVTLLAGDSGHLTYGRSQTTLASGNLLLLIRAYCGAPEAAFGAALAAFLGRLEDTDLGLDHDGSFRGLLAEAGDDPVMQTVQDAFFDRVYWEPAEAFLAHDARAELVANVVCGVDYGDGISFGCQAQRSIVAGGSGSHDDYIIQDGKTSTRRPFVVLGRGDSNPRLYSSAPALARRIRFSRWSLWSTWRPAKGVLQAPIGHWAFSNIASSHRRRANRFPLPFSTSLPIPVSCFLHFCRILRSLSPIKPHHLTQIFDAHHSVGGMTQSFE